jgi:hypothetical protein
MIKSSRFIVLLALLFVIMPSCYFGTQFQQAVNFLKCDFRLETIENLSLAGISLQQKKSYKDLSIVDIGKLSAAFLKNSFPLEFDLNIEAKNPNDQPASMNKMDWILFIDNTQFTQGLLKERVLIGPNNATTVFPVAIKADMMEVFSGESMESLVNLAINLLGQGNKPSGLTMKVRPSINIAGYDLFYPDYLTIANEFGGR